MSKRNKDRKKILVGPGAICHSCSQPMKRYKHSPEWKPLPGRTYMLFWDICGRCRRIQCYEHAFADREKGKRWKSGGAVPQNPRHVGEFYSSWEWKRLRYQTLQKRGARCECCGAKSSEGETIVVDHVIPIRRRWEGRLDPSNLQVLCRSCNMGKGSKDMTDWRMTPEQKQQLSAVLQQLGEVPPDDGDADSSPAEWAETESSERPPWE